MRIRVARTLDVSDWYRRAIRVYYDQEGLATREEVRRWIEQYGSSMDDDLALMMAKLEDGEEEQ